LCWEEDRIADHGIEEEVRFGARWREQTGHPMRGEARRLARKGMCWSAGLASTLGRGMAEEDDGTDEFIGVLLEELDEQIEPPSVVGGIEAGARTRGHQCLRRYAPLASPRGADGMVCRAP
jgi:glycine/D-amino acid oxidase-like deaminating enzyme